MKNVVMMIMLVLVVFPKLSFGITGSDTSKVLMPLSIGNTWIYEVTEYSDSFQVMKSYLDTVHIIKDTVIEGDHWYYQRTSSNNSIMMAMNFDDGVYWMLSSKDYQRLSDPFLAFPFPAENKFTYPFGDFTAEVIDNAVHTITPFGEADCIVVELRNEKSPITVEFLLMPGKGVINIVRKQNGNVMVTSQIAGMILN